MEQGVSDDEPIGSNFWSAVGLRLIPNTGDLRFEQTSSSWSKDRVKPDVEKHLDMAKRVKTWRPYEECWRCQQARLSEGQKWQYERTERPRQSASNRVRCSSSSWEISPCTIACSAKVLTQHDEESNEDIWFVDRHNQGKIIFSVKTWWLEIWERILPVMYEKKSNKIKFSPYNIILAYMVYKLYKTKEATIQNNQRRVEETKRWICQIKRRCGFQQRSWYKEYRSYYSWQ